jgi:peptidoglycan/LPS O-acetylase OafA/YrhL
MVLFGHSFALSDVPNPIDPLSALIWNYMPWKQTIQTMGVILFFGISGYLVTQSYMSKNHVLKYLLARCIRIYPALFVAVSFCVIVIGWSHTTLATREYFHHPVTLQYWWVNSTLKSVRFVLPGVFENQPVPFSVNGSLWTLPIELRLYLLVAVLGLLQVFRAVWLLNTIAAVGVFLFLDFPEKFPVMFAPTKPFLVVSFVLGMVFCINRERIKPDLLLLSCLVICCVVARYNDSNGIYDYLALLAFISSVFYLGIHSGIHLPQLDRFGDFSYGLYLYAFPIQQSIVAWLGYGKPWQVLGLSLSCTLLLAMLSWRYIESPLMGFGKWLTGTSVKATLQQREMAAMLPSGSNSYEN